MKRILLFPGMGDCHWVFLKLQSWLKAQGPEWEMPEVTIWDIDGRRRTEEYLHFIPWLKVGGYFSLDFKKDKKRFDSLYIRTNDGDVIRDFHGFDALIGFNGNMRNGKPFASLLEGAAINYQYGPVGIPDGPGKAVAAEGPYFIVAFSDFGMFERAWCRAMTAQDIRQMLALIRRAFPGVRILFTGSKWDEKFAAECVSRFDENWCGKTVLPKFLSMLKNSQGYIGWCGGNSILAQHLGIRTVVWWSKKYFPLHDRRGWETPRDDGTSSQLVLEVEDFKKHDTVHEMVSFLKGRKAIPCLS